MSYREYQTTPPPDGLATTWLLRPLGLRWLETLGEQKDWVAGLAKEAVKARFAGKSIDRTNLLTWSQDLSQSSWGNSGYTVTANAIVVPDGTSTGTKLVGTLTDSTITQSLTSLPGPVTFSLWLKVPSGSRNIYFYAIENTGAFLQYLATVTTDWQRFTLGGIFVGGSAGRVQIGGAATMGVGAELHVWGAQLEMASAATPYIATTYTPVTVSIPDANSAPSDALTLIGEERGLPRGLYEPEANYRARLIAAWEQWQWGGTAYGMLRAFQLAGFPSVIVQCQGGKQYTLSGSTGTVADLAISAIPAPVHLGGSPELWSDIAVLITKPWPAWWNDVAPADGSKDQKTAAAIITKWKNACNRCVKLVVVAGPTWGLNLTWGSFTWGGGTNTVWTPPAG